MINLEINLVIKQEINKSIDKFSLTFKKKINNKMFRKFSIIDRGLKK